MSHYKQIVDLEMWFCLLEKGKFAYINEQLCSFRIHYSQETKKNAKSFIALEDNFHLYDEYMHKPYITINTFHKEYIRYDNIYQIWKMYTAKHISKEHAVKEIDARYGYTKFLVYYPVYYLLYMIYKPLAKFYHKLGQRS